MIESRKVVIVPGRTSTQETYMPLEKALLNRGYKVELLDPRWKGILPTDTFEQVRKQVKNYNPNLVIGDEGGGQGLWDVARDSSSSIGTAVLIGAQINRRKRLPRVRDE